MAIYKFSNVGGFGTYQRYNDFLAGNPAVILDNGAYFPLGEFTLASAQANVEFTNIPQIYTHLQIRGISRSTDSSAFTQTNLTINNVITNYTLHQLFGDGSSATAFALTGQASTLFECMTANTATANIYGVTILDILDYKSINKNKTFRILAGFDANGSGRLALSSGMTTTNTNAVTSIKLTPRFGNFAANSMFALYGVLA
jgi:hypothetical protein